MHTTFLFFSFIFFFSDVKPDINRNCKPLYKGKNITDITLFHLLSCMGYKNFYIIEYLFIYIYESCFGYVNTFILESQI